MSVDVYPHDEQNRYRLVAWNDPDLRVLATAPDSGGLGAMIVQLDQDENEATGGYLGDLGSIGILDVVDGRWIIKPWRATGGSTW